MDGFEFRDFKHAWKERFTDEPPLELNCFTSEPGINPRDKYESALLDCKARIECLQEELAQQEFVATYLTVALQSKYGLDSLSQSPASTDSAMFTPLVKPRDDYGNDTGDVRSGVEDTDMDAGDSGKDTEIRLSTPCSTNASSSWTTQDSEELKKVRFSVFSNITDVVSTDANSPSSICSSPDVMSRRERGSAMSNALDSPVVCPPAQMYAEERIYDEPFAVVKGEVDESAESSDEEPVYYNVLLMKHQSMAANHGPIYANSNVLEKKCADIAAKHFTEVTNAISEMDSPSKLDTSLSPTVDETYSQKLTWKKRQSMQLATNLSTSDTSEADDLDMVVSPCPEAETLQMRQWVISSILDSERAYVDVLNTLQQATSMHLNTTLNIFFRYLSSLKMPRIQKYMKPFKSLAENPHTLITTEDIETIFCNIPELYKIHCDFICELEPRVRCWTSATQIAELFKVLAIEEYPLATKYLKNYHDAVATIRKCSQQNSQFRNATQEISCKGLTDKPSLEELLHKPVVRVQRNTLALHDLIKCTPTSHADYDMLQKTLKIAQNFLENFNETMDKDNVENMRYLVKQGLVVEKSGNHRKLRHLFVFKDLIVGAKQRISNRQKVHYDCKWYIALADLELDTRTGAQDDPCMPDGKRREISLIEHRVSVLQNELKIEMKKMKQAEQGQRHWSMRSHTKTIDKLKRKLAEQEAALLKISPHLLFSLKDKKVDKTYFLLMSSDYERSVWRDTILGLMAQARTTVNISIPDLQQLINSQKKLQDLRLTLERDDLGLEEEYLYGSLYVTIHKLQGLSSDCDCFCTMETDAFGHFCTKAKTSIVCGSTEPTWNQGFEIDLDGAQTLRILCYKLGNETDSLLGKCALELSRAWLRGDFQEKTISLNEKVQLTLSLKYINSQQTLSRTPSAVKGGIFGVKLGVVATREGLQVPIIVTSCIEEVERRGLSEVGLYRVSGLSGQIQSLKKAYEKNSRGAVQLLRDTDIHVVTCLLKLYYRELPEALFTDHLYPHLVEGISLSDPEAKEKCMVSLLLSLPHQNLATVNVMLTHLVRVSEMVENKMSINNLSTVFGPTLLKPATKRETVTVTTDLFSEGTRDVMMQTSILHYFLTLKVKGRYLGFKM